MKPTKSTPLIKAIQIDVIPNMSNPIACFNNCRMNPRGLVEGYAYERKHYESFTMLLVKFDLV